MADLATQGHENSKKGKTWNHKHNTTMRATTTARPDRFIRQPD